MTNENVVIGEETTAWKYETDKVALIPYVSTEKAVFPEETLVSLYGRLQREGTIEILFPGRSKFCLSEFVHYFHDKPILVGMVKQDETWKIMGFGWLFETEGPKGARKASCGYAFFREFWGKDELRKVARLALRYWFTELSISIIYGAAVKANVRAQRFNRELGFRQVAELERWFIQNGSMYDAVIFALKREEFFASEV